ncbi:MAG TPA: IS21 family transposase [Candidatus Nitrosotenuis sp.]|nr:IS21 family transposase [Candidatus Nitrosotenuis sp.]
MVDYRNILDELRAHCSARGIQDKGLASRNTVKGIIDKVRPLGWLDPANPLPSPDEIAAVLGGTPPVPVRVSTVEPYRDKVEAWVRAGHTPKQIFGALKRETAFSGSLGAVKRFVRRLARPEPKACVVLHFEPGEAAQVDFGSGPVLPHPQTGRPTRTQVFVMTLCHSRHLYAEVVWDQKVGTWLRCHRHAFEFFQGVPRRVIIDNLRSAITRACHRDPEIQKSYGAFSRAWGFQVVPCRPRTPRHKGRVERGVAYIKGSFLPLREFRDLADANQQLQEWILGEAGNRLHGTTQEVPLRVFAEREKPVLQPLPDPLPELVVWSKARLHPNCHITFEKSFYSAPYRYVGLDLLVRAGEKMVELYLEDQRLVACHARAERPGTWRTVEEHYPPQKVAHLQKTPQWCLRRARDVGPNCEEFIRRLLGDRVMDRLAGAQGVLRLGERYGQVRLEVACTRALAFEAIRWRAVKSILERGLDQIPHQPDGSGQLHLPFVEAPRFGRDIGQLLAES